MSQNMPKNEYKGFEACHQEQWPGASASTMFKSNLPSQRLLDAIDFGDIVSCTSLSLAESSSPHDGLLYSLEPIDFDLQEFPEFFEPPKLQREDRKDSWEYLYTDRVDAALQEEILPEQFRLFLPIPNQQISKPPVGRAQNRRNQSKCNKIPRQSKSGADEDFDVLTSTLDFLKLHREKILPNFTDSNEHASAEEDNGEMHVKSIQCLSKGKQLVYASLLHDKEMLRKKSVQKYLRKRKSLLKNSFIKQRALANAYIAQENMRKLKQPPSAGTTKLHEQKKNVRSSVKVKPEPNKEHDMGKQHGSPHKCRRKRKSFDSTHRGDNCGGVVCGYDAPDSVFSFKRPCLTRIISVR
jgi:hypothetical protein